MESKYFFIFQRHLKSSMEKYQIDEDFNHNDVYSISVMKTQINRIIYSFYNKCKHSPSKHFVLLTSLFIPVQILCAIACLDRIKRVIMLILNIFSNSKQFDDLIVVKFWIFFKHISHRMSTFNRRMCRCS